MKKATKSKIKLRATQAELSVDMLSIVEKAQLKISTFINAELKKLEKRIRKQVKDELKGKK